MLIDILIIFFLIVLNGFFAMSEMAVVSSRKARLTLKAEAGNRGAKTALALANDPSKFLASIQIGITLIGILSGAYSGATLAEPLGDYFATHGIQREWADDAAIALVVISVTYLSLTIGELVPKQLALKYAEPIACFVARPITLLSLIAKPIVWLLHCSNMLLLRLLGVDPTTTTEVTEEEVKAVIAEGMDSGALAPGEKEMLERILRLDDFGVRIAMTHRQDWVWFDVDEPVASVLEKVERTRHSRFLVGEGSLDRLLGVVVVKDLLLQMGRSETLDLRSILRKPLYLDESVSVLHALEEFKQSTSSIAVLIDEYGAPQGIVTLKDMMEAIIGELPEPAHREDFSGTQREDGSWLLDAGLSILETEELLGVTGMASEDDDYHTLAGFILSHTTRIPHPGDHFNWNGWRFEVVDMDRNRIDKVLAAKLGQ